MKKIILFILLFASYLSSNSQISMIGTALPAELQMAQFSLYEYQQQATFTTGTIKFREGFSWNVNWGNNSFPSGTGFQNGADIPVVAGTYVVTFNRSTGNYTFTPATPTPIISIVGSGVNGWPPDITGSEITLSTLDGVSYSINNLVITSGFVKFRKDYSWTTNWGGSTFPNGVGVQDGVNTPTTAGTYNVTININNGTYTFIPASIYPSIGIWGPAVNSQLGYAAPDVDMATTDGIHYTLSGFYFSSGNCFFRQNDNATIVWGATSFPSGVATSTEPSLFVPSGEYYVTFNRITGEYSFVLPVISLIGTSLLGWETDVEMSTNDGENYTLYYPQGFSIGECKFRKNYSWDISWSGDQFPSGNAFPSDTNLVIPSSEFNIATFNRYSLAYSFGGLLANNNFEKEKTTIYPNPTKSNWTILSDESIKQIELYNLLGKLVYSSNPLSKEATINTIYLEKGVYFAKIQTSTENKIVKLIKK